MNRISKIITDRMKELQVSEYQVCKDLDIIQQSFNFSLKAANSWKQSEILYKVLRYLGLEPAETIAGETPAKLSKENSELRAKLRSAESKNKSLEAKLKRFNKVLTPRSRK